MTDRNEEDAGPRLLSGGNPQIPKGEGDGPVQDYIAAMPGWKRNVGQRLDDLIVHTVPAVHKAVKWNQPFYGFEDEGWFLSFRCYTNYVQVQFFKGASLEPVPPKASKHEEVRYLDIRETDELSSRRPISSASCVSFCIMLTSNQASSGILSTIGPRYCTIGEAMALWVRMAGAVVVETVEVEEMAVVEAMVEEGVVESVQLFVFALKSRNLPFHRSQ